MLIVWVLVPAAAQFNPQPKGITKRYFADPDVSIGTPGVLKKKGFMSHEELTVYLAKLATQHPQSFDWDTLGHSALGRPIYSIHLPALSEDQPLRLWIQGGLHGDEPASSEGVLHFLHECLTDPQMKQWRDRVEVFIVPVANVDGYEASNRYAANGLDLNRDQTKMMTVETQMLKRAFTAFNPHVAVDFHEYRPFRKDFARLGSFGVTSRNDAMFLYTGNLNIPDTVRQVIERQFVNPAKAVMTENGYVTDNYSTSFDHHGEIHFNTASFHARSSATNYALNNTISTLIEVRGVGIGKTSFLRRTHITYLIARTYLEQSYVHATNVKSLLEVRKPANDRAYVEMSRTVGARKMTFIDVSTFEEIELDVIEHNALQMNSEKSRSIPDYYILPETAELTEKLNLLGIQFSLEEPKGGQWWGYLAEQVEVEPYPYEGRTIQNVSAALTPVEPQEGTWIFIPTQQQRRAMLVELLEPETKNGWIHFSLLPAKTGTLLDIFRYHI